MRDSAAKSLLVRKFFVRRSWCLLGALTWTGCIIIRSTLMLDSDDDSLSVCVSRIGSDPLRVWALFVGTSFCLRGTSFADFHNLGYYNLIF